jgi:hypothetical protein
MQLVQLRDDAVIAGYDYVWEPFADAAAKAGQRTDAAIATDVLDSRNKLKRVARRINGADAASTATIRTDGRRSVKTYDSGKMAVIIRAN